VGNQPQKTYKALLINCLKRNKSLFGGTGAGTVTVDNFGGSRHRVEDIRIDFLAGSLMVLELTNPVESGGVPDERLGWSNTGSETGLDWA
jgi:hypothetical protein